MSINSEAQKLDAGSVVRLFELDGDSAGAGTLRFHGHNQGPIVFNGLTYQPYPVRVEGLAKDTDRPSRPTLSVANVDGSISALCNLFDDMVGFKVTIRSTLAKFIDAVNFPGVGNPDANPLEKFPDEVYYVERKSGETREQVDFELSSVFDFQDVQLPRRQVISNRCMWVVIGGYRGPYCGYAGPPVATAADVPTTDPALDSCSGSVAGCKLRFGADAELPIGSFPAAGLVRT